MSFWSDRLAPQQPATPAPAPASNRPWWQVPSVPQAPQQPAYAPQQPAPVHQQQASVTPSGEQHFGDLLHQDGYTTDRAQSAKDSEPCPDCGSPNFMAPAGNPNAMKQCFNCGWNPRFQHSTHGASGIGNKDLPTYQARSQTLSKSNFNPSTPVAHIS